MGLRLLSTLGVSKKEKKKDAELLLLELLFARLLREWSIHHSSEDSLPLGPLCGYKQTLTLLLKDSRKEEGKKFFFCFLLLSLSQSL